MESDLAPLEVAGALAQTALQLARAPLPPLQALPGLDQRTRGADLLFQLLDSLLALDERELQRRQPRLALRQLAFARGQALGIVPARPLAAADLVDVLDLDLDDGREETPAVGWSLSSRRCCSRRLPAATAPALSPRGLRPLRREGVLDVSQGRTACRPDDDCPASRGASPTMAISRRIPPSRDAAWRARARHSGWRYLAVTHERAAS